ncbi:MAG TPA: 1,6-anhydro-N-acetylmuramyl-L-alanine amidase AmpD, partial [Gammaproteobacteria bacterium]|nr:1,6-anhydro-N-acetylmuramyl-L-alanine amidase AmpD [Gammaproteobacteria bacterium]
GEFGSRWIDDLFINCLDATAHAYFAAVAPLRVSAHVLISRDGRLTQFVSFAARAWHAGQSSYRGRPRCNDFSIGIELEGADDVPYEGVQYRRLAELVNSLRSAYPTLAGAELVGHSDIAPGRKTDPGPSFDWNLLRGLLTPGVLSS